jgi:hypothetical protein
VPTLRSQEAGNRERDALIVPRRSSCRLPRKQGKPKQGSCVGSQVFRARCRRIPRGLGLRLRLGARVWARAEAKVKAWARVRAKARASFRASFRARVRTGAGVWARAEAKVRGRARVWIKG